MIFNMKFLNCIDVFSVPCLVYCIIILNCITSGLSTQGEFIEVSISQGLLKGKVLKSREGREFVGFMGIPFAKTPERFQPAKLPPPTWDGIRDATDYGTKCLQFNFTTLITEGDEDCLFINVFSPNVNGNASVLAFIHGGGFQFGLAYENGPEFIMDHDVVFITFSYRLASLGFLTTGDNVIPGNIGLKDQMLALKWIQDNIHFLGGDKNRVTLFGESAGSASVSYHILSPLSRGLFHKAVCMSGSALDRWPLVDNPSRIAKHLAEKLGCPIGSSGEILECLKTKPGKDIVNVQIRTSLVESAIVYGPVLEAEGSLENPAFLTEHPKILYEEGRFSKVPLIMTFNNVEGLLLNALGVLSSPELTAEFNNDWNRTVAISFDINKESYSKESILWATTRLKEYYFGTKLVGNDTLMNLTNMYTDGFFAQRARKTAFVHGKYAPAYTTVLAFKGIWSQTFAQYGFKQILGMTHADDLSYLFTDHKYPPFPADSASERFSKFLVKLWVNFANTGDPGLVLNDQKWNPISKEEISTETINWLYLKNEPEFLVEPLQESMRLWDQIDSVLETGIIPSSKDEL